MTEEEMLEIDPEEVFAWDVDSIDAVLNQLDDMVGTTWPKAIKTKELYSVLQKMQNPNQCQIQCSMIAWRVQIMQRQMKNAEKRMAEQMKENNEVT